MSRRPVSQSLRDRILSGLEDLDHAFNRRPDHQDFAEPNLSQHDVSVRLAALAQGLRLALNTLASSVGECQVETPYAAIQLVRHPDGRREWCCAHRTAHCDPA